MSASPMARQATDSQTIPTRKVFINDAVDLPHSYSSTPGGTLYSTTPGGTKLVYEKSVLMNLRNSPISKTPPTYGIPEHLQKGAKNANPNKRIVKNNIPTPYRPNKKHEDGHEDQFQLDL